MTAGQLTVADWRSLPDDLLRHEIIDGVHYTQRGATLRHQEVLAELMCALRLYARERHDVIIHLVGTVFSEHDAVIPDIVYIQRDRRAIVGDDYIEGVPDIVVEIVSEESRVVDRTVKYDLYERAGVSEYWIVDFEEETVDSPA